MTQPGDLAGGQLMGHGAGLQPARLTAISSEQLMSKAVKALDQQIPVRPETFSARRSDTPSLASSVTNDKGCLDDIPVTAQSPEHQQPEAHPQPQGQLSELYEEIDPQGGRSEDLLAAGNESTRSQEYAWLREHGFNHPNTSAWSFSTSSSISDFASCIGDPDKTLDQDGRTVLSDGTSSCNISNGDSGHAAGKQLCDQNSDKSLEQNERGPSPAVPEPCPASKTAFQRSSLHEQAILSDSGHLVASPHDGLSMTWSHSRGQSSRSERHGSVLQSIVYNHLRQESDASSVPRTGLDADNQADCQIFHSRQPTAETRLSTAGTHSHSEQDIYQEQLLLDSSQQPLDSRKPKATSHGESEEAHLSPIISHSLALAASPQTLATGKNGNSTVLSHDYMSQLDQAHAKLDGETQAEKCHPFSSGNKPVFVQHRRNRFPPISDSKGLTRIGLNNSLIVGPTYRPAGYSPTSPGHRGLQPRNTLRYSKTPNDARAANSQSKNSHLQASRPAINPNNRHELRSPSASFQNSDSYYSNSCFFYGGDSFKAYRVHDRVTMHPQSTIRGKDVVFHEAGRPCCTPRRGNLRHGASSLRGSSPIEYRGYPSEQLAYVDPKAADYQFWSNPAHMTFRAAFPHSDFTRKETMRSGPNSLYSL
ncbi:hypothetical protein FCOIX_12304 [Fusarium coicis]|nr:hypothetical protein FCOIX_12304 [Fusarium coicis]